MGFNVTLAHFSIHSLEIKTTSLTYASMYLFCRHCSSGVSFYSSMEAIPTAFDDCCIMTVVGFSIEKINSASRRQPQVLLDNLRQVFDEHFLSRQTSRVVFNRECNR